MRRLAVYSSDPEDVYSFLLPIAAVAWSRMGYTPVALLHGRRERWRSSPKTSLILGLVEPISIVRHVDPVSGWSVPTIAACSRLFAAALPDVEDDDYLLTSDVDLLPLQRAYFDQPDCSRSFSLLNADGYGDFAAEPPVRFPLCHVGARATRWRELLGLTTRDIDLEIARSTRGWVDRWGQDELFFAAALRSHACFDGPLEQESETTYRKGDCQLITRGFVHGIAARRLDRAVEWRFRGARDLIDCHVHRPAYENIEPLLGVLETYFPADLPFFRSYFTEFLALKAREARTPGRSGRRRHHIAFAGCSVSIEYDEAGQPMVQRLFAALPSRRHASDPSPVRIVSGRDPQSLAVYGAGTLRYEGRCCETAATQLLDAVHNRLAERSSAGMLLHAASVARHGRGILLPGPSGSGKSSLAAWLAHEGFDLLGDEAAFVRYGGTRVEGFTTPLTIKEAGRGVVEAWLRIDAAAAPRVLVSGEQLNPQSTRTAAKLCLLVFPTYAPGVPFELVALSKADAAMRLSRALANAAALPDGGFDEIVRLVRTVPAYAVRYSHLARVGAAIESLLATREQPRMTERIETV